jgi:hypothetical protein
MLSFECGEALIHDGGQTLGDQRGARRSVDIGDADPNHLVTLVAELFADHPIDFHDATVRAVDQDAIPGAVEYRPELLLGATDGCVDFVLGRDVADRRHDPDDLTVGLAVRAVRLHDPAAPARSGNLVFVLARSRRLAREGSSEVFADALGHDLREQFVGIPSENLVCGQRGQLFHGRIPEHKP